MATRPSTTTRKPPARAKAPKAPKAVEAVEPKPVEVVPTDSTSDHPLAHLIPEQFFSTNYESRHFDGFRDIDVLDQARRMRWNTLMYGPTGPGKTACVMAYGAEKQIPVVYVACNGAVDPATMFVQPVSRSLDVDDVLNLARQLTETLGQKWENLEWSDQLHALEVASKMLGETLELVESNVVSVMRLGGILYLDEVNALPPRIAMVLHGALDLRRTITLPQKGNEPVALHPNCQVIASYNPNYAGTKPLNEAFKNRFGLPLPFNYDPEIEAKLIVGIPSLLDLAQMLRQAQDEGNLETPVGPNALLEFEELAETFSVDFAVSNFVNRFEPGERASVRETIMSHFIDRINEEFDAWSEVDDDDVEPDPDDVDTASRKTTTKGRK